MSYQFKIKVFVGHRPVGWLKVSEKQTGIVLGLRSASKFESTTPSVFGAAMAELELPEPEKGGVPPGDLPIRQGVTKHHTRRG